MADEHAEHPQAEREQPDRRGSSSAPPGSTSRRSTSGARRPTPEFLAKDPAAPDADARGGRPAARRAVGELRDHAVPLQQARPRPLLPDRSGRAGDGRQRDVLPDRHALSAASRARPTRRSASRSTRARSATSDADDEMKAKARKDAEAALAEPLDVYRRSSSTATPFIGGDSAVDRRHPARGDARVPAGDRLRLPGLGEEYMARDGGGARRRVLGAGRRRARLHRLRALAEWVSRGRRPVSSHQPGLPRPGRGSRPRPDGRPDGPGHASPSTSTCC